MSNASSVTVTDIFCGAGGFTTGAVAAGADVRFAANHWSRAIETHNTNYPHIDHFLADISLANPRSFPRTTGLIASPECFPAGTLILTMRGFVPIEQVREGDQVFTHRNRWKPVTAIIQTVKDTIIVQGDGHYGLETTPEHPFLARQRVWKNKRRRVLSDPAWVPARDLRSGTLWASPILSETGSLPIPEVGGRGVVFCNEFWWMVGKWLADGVVTEKAGGKKHIRISCSFAEVDETYERLNFNPPSQFPATKGEYQWSREKREHQVLPVTSHTGLGVWLTEQFGKLAHGKTLPSWALTMPEESRKSLLDGYLFGDGTYNSARGGYTFTTVSKSLAIGIRLLALSLGYPCWLSKQKGDYTETIQGVSFTRREQYVGSFIEEPKLENAVEDGAHLWFRVGEVQPGQTSQTVYNLSVEDDESYVADGMIVHNCTNHSLAKGKRRKGLAQRRLLEDEPLADEAEVRSRATMWDPLRLAEVHNYQFVVLENVVDVRFWSEWMNWVHAWKKLDYVLQLVYLNSMFCHPTPQSRDRLYIVATKRRNRRPNLQITPRAYCGRCGQDVLSVQSWKDPLKRHGKYGKHGQYLYRCSQCAEVVQPYYYAAANAIDWSIPTVRIGDRKRPLEPKTVQRVKLGLRKFCGQQPFLTQVNKTSDRIHELTGVLPTQTAVNGLGLIHPPFLIAMNHGGGDERRVFPLERAMSTQTSREELALIAPPFTFELNHAQMQTTSVLDQPLRTQTTYDDTALVVPPFLIELRNHATARGLEESLPTVCAGGEHHALITPPPFLIDHIHEYRLREITDPLSTIVAEGNHQSVVYPAWLMTYYQNGQMSPVEQAVPTVTTLDRHALVTAPTSEPEINYEDCGFRMLDPSEIQAAMAFPKEYVVTGNRREMVKQLGNACTPPAIEKIMVEVLASLDG